jgi:hypothetical protein
MARGLMLALALFGFVSAAEAQAPADLVGTWERVSLKNADGKDTQPPAPAAFLIISANGYYSQISIPTGRPKVDKPLAQMTKEELVARFDRVEARRGRYTVKGNVLTRRYDAGADPNQEGTEAGQLFRIEGDMLILSSADPKQKNEARFRRVK